MPSTNRMACADDLARPLHEYLVRPVDHHLGDSGVVEQRVDGPVAEHVAGDLGEQMVAFHLGEAGASLFVERPLQRLQHPASQLVIGQRPVVKDGSELFDDPEMHADAQLFVQRCRRLSTTLRQRRGYPF